VRERGVCCTVMVWKIDEGGDIAVSTLKQS